MARLAKHSNDLEVSSVWETSPIGFADQPNYLNAGAILSTPLSVNKLCQTIIFQIEKSLGRTRDSNNKNGPRTIDIDLMLFNNDILVLNNRRIPHPEILSRPFVARTLAELDPGYVHPETGQTLEEIARTLDISGPDLRRRIDVNLLPLIQDNSARLRE